MKLQILTAALLVTTCAGCQSSTPLLGWMGHDGAKSLASTASNSSLSEAKLPPPTNDISRNSRASVSSVDEHLQLGEAELNLGRYAQARNHFESVLQQQPQHGKANHRMGVLCDKLGEYENAERYYRLAILQDPRDAAILSDLGYSYWLQGRYADSERTLLQARQVDPQYKNAIANLGMVYGTTGRETEALALFRQIGDETTAQDFMSQVTALAHNSSTGSGVNGSMSPIVQTSHQTTPATNVAHGNLEDASDETRKILDAMEEGRRQRELAEQARAQEQAARTAAAQQRPIPPFVQNRTNPQQGFVPQMAGVDPFQGQPNMQQGRPQQQPRIPDAYLNEALARIDQSDRPTPSDGPITLGPNASPQYDPSTQAPPETAFSPTQITSGGFSQQYASQNPPAAVQPLSQPPLNSTGYPMVMQDGSASMPQMASNQPPQVGQGAPTGYMQPTELQPAQPQTSPTVITYGTPRRDPSYAPSSYAPQSSTTYPTVTNNGVRQASTFTQGTGTPLPNGQNGYGQQPVEHALHQQQQGVQPSIDLLAGPSNPNGNSSLPEETTAPYTTNSTMPQTPGSQWPLVPSATVDPNDPYQQARRQAAIMGLGAGPEQLFPYVQQTQRAVPGSGSMWNGAQYPPPQRQLPTDRNPADLSPAFAPPQATNLTPGPNYLGHQLPPVAAPVNAPTQYGAPTSAAFQQYQQSEYQGPMATSYTQAYENIREQSNQQLSQLINQTYGQPIQTPPSGVATLPSQNYHAPQTEELSHYNSPQANNPVPQLTPPQFAAPAAQTNQIEQYGSPQAVSPGQQIQPASTQGIVIPEQYQPATNVGYQPSRSSRQSTFTSPTTSSVNTLPVIVPGER